MDVFRLELTAIAVAYSFSVNIVCNVNVDFFIILI